jgi:Uma2 family endonuclease
MTEAALQPRLDDPSQTDLFYWGSRWVRNGGRFVEVPLTRADVLDPREGDMMVHSVGHGLQIRSLADMLQRCFRSRGEDVAVFDDVKIVWDVPGVSNPAPDVSVIPGIADPRQYREVGEFSVAEEGLSPCLVIEVVSPRYSKIDHQDKVALYGRLGVPEYLILDVLKKPIELTAYRLDTRGRYRRDGSRRRWRSQQTDLLFQAGREPLEIRVKDLRRDVWLLTSSEVEDRLAAEIDARREAERRAAELQAELKRLRHDQRSSK